MRLLLFIHCVFRYSAAHREKVNLLCRLTALDAWQRGLVKQIWASSNQIAGGFSRPYIRLLPISHKNGFRMRVELDVKDKNGSASRKAVNICQSSDLFKLSGKRELYKGSVLSRIDCTPGMEQIEFTNTAVFLLGGAIGDVDKNV